MPELPDVVVYLEQLERRILGRPLAALRIANPFLLRSIEPTPEEVAGREVEGLRRLGKRLVIGLKGEIFVVVHLMIAGRLRWKPVGARAPGRIGLAAFDFPNGTLLLTEAGSKRRASLHLVRGVANLAEHDRGGVDPLAVGLDGFRAALTRESHTLKRALTDPRFLGGIGNAYSDEILHRARLSPFRLSGKLDEAEWNRLWRATRETLTQWIEELRARTGEGFPEKVTAFREGMAVHGRFGQPCPDCGTPVQRIVSAETEAHYCPRCQTEGRLLADRALSRLLRGDWPRTIAELEARRRGRDR